MNLKILNIVLFVMLVNILGNCTLGSCSQNGGSFTENSSNNTENLNNNTENLNNIPQRLPLTFGPGTFDELKKDPNFIAAYGSIPTFATSEERDQWIDELYNVIKGENANFDQEMSKYFYPNGPVTGYGVTVNGVIQVGINKSNTVDKPFMDEIYLIFDSKASRIGIKEIPVVFVQEDNFVPAVDSESPKLKINNSGGDIPSENNSIPGFGLLGSLTCLYSGWRLTKK
jgi:hypothetical protein